MAPVSVLAQLLRPQDCLACGRPGAWPCCHRCMGWWAGAPGPWPLRADPRIALWSLGGYGDGLRAVILGGKLRGQAAALDALGRRLGAELVAAGAGADLVTWVASSGARGAPRDHA